MQRNDEVINESYARLLEIIKFSKLQMEKLGNYEIFNRHVIQILPEMALLIEKLCNAGADENDLKGIVEKYSEYVHGSKDEEALATYEQLKEKYPVFNSLAKY